jgi:hypothetical protein
MSGIWVIKRKVLTEENLMFSCMVENAVVRKFIKRCIRSFVAGDAASRYKIHPCILPCGQLRCSKRAPAVLSLYALHSSLLREAPKTNNLIHRHEHHSRLEAFNSQNNDGFEFMGKPSDAIYFSDVKSKKIFRLLCGSVLGGSFKAF